MPVNITPSNALFRGADYSPAVVARLGEECIVTGQAEGHVGPFVGNVLLTCQRGITMVAAKVFNVKRRSLGRGVFLGEDQLIAGRAPGNFEHVGQVTCAVNLSSVVKVHQIGKEFFAFFTLETLRMPGGTLAGFFRSFCLDGDFTHVDALLTTAASDRFRRSWKRDVLWCAWYVLRSPELGRRVRQFCWAWTHFRVHVHIFNGGNRR